MADTLGRATSRIANAFWRAATYCLHPTVIGLSLLPLLIAAGAATAFMYWGWEGAVAGVRQTMESWSLVASFLTWLDHVGMSAFRTVLAPMIVLAFVVPAIVVLSILFVALFMTPAMVRLVARRRFPALEKQQGASFFGSVMWSLGHTLLAMLMLLVSLPFWLIPPLVLFLPPLIWGWLCYRVFAYDVLAEHATADERRAILHEHRLPLLALGLVCGYLGAAPVAIWAVSAFTVAFAPVLVLLSLWLHTLVFVFTSLWFAHYALSALDDSRRAVEAAPAAPTTVVEVLDPLPRPPRPPAGPLVPPPPAIPPGGL